MSIRARLRIDSIAARWLHFSLCILVCFVSSEAYAQCSATISDLRIYHEPSQYSPTVEVDYALSGANGNLSVEVIGLYGAYVSGVVSGSGTFHATVPAPFQFAQPGNYTYHAVLTADCGNPQARDELDVVRYYDPRPTAAGTVTGFNADKTQMTVSVDYSFPYAPSTGSGDGIRVYVDGAAEEIRLDYYGSDPWQGTKVMTVNRACLGNGNHLVSFETVKYCPPPIVCLASAPGERETFAIKQAEITSFDVQPLDDYGTLRFTAGYRFESTGGDYDRRVIFSFGGSGTILAAPDVSGSLTWDLGLSCLSPGTYTASAKAVACGRTNDPRYTDEKQTTITVPVKLGNIELEALLDPSGHVALNGTAHLPPGVTNGTVVITRLPYVDDEGHVQAAVTVGGPIAVSVSNPEFSSGDTPPSGRDIPYQALLSYCNGAVSTGADATPTFCPIGDHQPPSTTGHPVAYTNGSMRYSEHDPLPRLMDGIVLERTYDSYNHARGSFGRGWTSIFDNRLFITTNSVAETISLSAENGFALFEHRGGAYEQLWPSGRNAADTLSYDATNGVYVYRRLGETTALLYRGTDGRFVGYRDLGTGHEARITYDPNGLPASVTDNWTNTTWAISVDSVKKRVASIAIGSLTWVYEYDANDHLTGVLAPSGAGWRTYTYIGDLLADVHDAVGNLIEAHTYDGSGHAITESSQADDIRSIEYDAAGSTPTQKITNVTMRSGAVTTWTLQPIGGTWRTVKITGTCSSCGSRDSAYVYDSAGHVVREQNASGYITTRTYNSGHLASVQEHQRPSDCDPATSQTHCRLEPGALATTALTPTSATITTTYEYADPLFPDKPTTISTPSVAEGSRRETFAYHPLTGEVVIHGSAGVTPTGEQPITTVFLYGDALPGGTADDRDPGTINSYAPAFDPGGVFQSAWLSLAQPRLRRSIDGPRTDANDVTLFVYYPVDPSVPAGLRGRLAAVKNSAGHITRYENYDVFGNPTRISDPNGVATEMTYDALGRLLTSTIKAVSGCDTSKDALCNTDLTTTRTYSQGSGPLDTEQRPGGGTTKYEYDTKGRVTTISRGASLNDLREQIVTTYDDEHTGHKSTETINARENTTWVEKTSTSYAYDTLGQLQTITTSSINPTTNQTVVATFTYAYDESGRLASVTDENHTAPNTTYAYDPAGRLNTVTQTLSTATGGSITTRYGYDAHGNLTSVTDPNGNVTQYAYDDFGRMVTQTSTVTGVTRYEYDAAGNLERTIDANQMMTERSYDALNRVISATASKLSSAEDPPPSRGEEPPPASAPSPSPEVIQWTYDDPTVNSFSIGRVSSMSDPVGITTYEYERRGLQRLESRTITTCLTTRDSGRQCTTDRTDTTRYAYDVDGNRNKIVYPSGVLTVDYTHDYAGRPLTASGFVLSATYLPFGPLTTLQFPNGTTQTFTYDHRYRMTSNQLSIDGTPGQPGIIAGYKYEYDTASNITRIGDVKEELDYSRRFTYDDLNRLTLARTSEDTPPRRSPLWGKAEYAWDNIGNILRASIAEVEPGGPEELPASNPKKFQPPNRKRTNTAIVAPLGRVNTFAYNGTTPVLSAVTLNDLSRPVNHDTAGNELHYVVQRSYSPRNLLTQVIDDNDPGELFPHQVAYAYDGRGLRVLRAEFPANGLTIARRSYVYTPELRLLSMTRNDTMNVWEAGADPQPTIGNNVHHEIIWFGDRPVGQADPGAFTRYTFTDHLGTPLLQTDSTRAVVWRVEYEPFGNIYDVREGVRTDQPLRFPGQDFGMTWEGPEESYNIFRWYKSSWGRYTQADPIGLSGGIDLYAYVNDNPIMFADLNGLSKTPPCTKDTALGHCADSDTGCCVAKCIDDLRFSRCMEKKQEKVFGVIGALLGAGFGIGVAPKNGVGTVCGAVIGGGVGYFGAVGGYYGYEWAITKAGMWKAFSACMKNCGRECGNGNQCKNFDLFQQVWAEK